MGRVNVAFLPLWTAAVMATASAFVLDLALRGRSVQLGYELGAARQEQARLREVERVLELEAASYKTPERVEFVARSLLGMESPPPERIVSLGPITPSDDGLDMQASEAIPRPTRTRHDERAGAVPP